MYGNPGDYAWGVGGLDAIITQVGNFGYKLVTCHDGLKHLQNLIDIRQKFLGLYNVFYLFAL